MYRNRFSVYGIRYTVTKCRIRNTEYGNRDRDSKVWHGMGHVHVKFCRDAMSCHVI